MRIKTKLAASSCTILLLMALVGVACIAGIKHIERNIFYLTQKSTPYQVKTFNHQRALQSHASNLLKIASAESLDDFGKISIKCTDSLAEETKAAEELTALGSPSDYQGTEITDITGRIRDNTGKRLTLQRETDSAVAMMRTNLAEASKRLKELDASIRKLQGAATVKMVSNINITADSNNQSAMIASLLSGLKDLTLFTSQLMNASDREAVEAAYESTSNPLHKMTDLVGLIRWSGKLSRQDYLRKLEFVGDKLTEAKDTRVEFLQSRAASSRAKILQAVKEAETEIINLREGAKGQAEAASSTQEASADAMSSSTSSFESTNSILLLTSGILFSGAAVESQINYGIAARSTSDFDKIASTVHAEFMKIDSSVRELVKLLGNSKHKKELSQVNGSLAALDVVKKSFFGTGGASEKIKASLKSAEEVSRLNQRMKDMVAQQMELSGKDVAVAQQGQQLAVSSVRSAVKATTTLIIVIAGISVFASLLLSRWIGLSITRPIGELSTMAERFGSGDFGIRMDASRKDEFGVLGAHFNEATSKLAQMTGLLKGSIGKLTVRSERLSTTSDRLYRGAQEQVSQTTQSSVAMAEISATVETVAGHARSSAAASKQAHSIAADGNVLVAKTVQGMHEIAESVMAAATMINKLSESSERIDSILLAINDIADQTNLLSLNAAIEAARAGAHGQGFAVVADEVRKLSQRTALSTREIAGIIQTIQVDTAGSVEAMAEGKRKVEEGRSLVAAARDSLDAIVTVSHRGVEMADLIATATCEQASVSREVSDSMDKILTVTGTLKDSTMEIKEASEQLSSIAGELNGMASWFKVAV